jgi:hypothetical protein
MQCYHLSLLLDLCLRQVADVFIQRNADGRVSGEAFVRLPSREVGASAFLWRIAVVLCVSRGVFAGYRLCHDKTAQLDGSSIH